MMFSQFTLTASIITHYYIILDFLKDKWKVFINVQYSINIYISTMIFFYTIYFVILVNIPMPQCKNIPFQVKVSTILFQ